MAYLNRVMTIPLPLRGFSAMSMILSALRRCVFQPVAHRRYRFSGLLPMALALFALAALPAHAATQTVTNTDAATP